MNQDQDIEIEKRADRLQIKPVFHVPLIRWHEIGTLLGSNHNNRQEFDTMPLIKADSLAFAILISDDQYAPYLNPGDIILIEPCPENTLGKRVLVELKGHFHIMEHSIL